MTIVFSSASEQLIAMTVDSAVALDFERHREYTTEPKMRRIPGIGAVTTWGTRNDFQQYLAGKNLSPQRHTVIDLANLMYEYLTRSYQPHKLELDDVGFHIGGFDRQEKSLLFHVYWGCKRPNPSGLAANYHMENLSPQSGIIPLLYNGRNDLVDGVVQKLISEINKGAELRFNIRQRNDQARVGDFFARFAAELTPEVGPPFFTALILPDNSMGIMKNDSMCPVTEEDAEKKLRRS